MSNSLDTRDHLPTPANETAPAPIEQSSTAMMGIIEAVVARPDVDIDKIERLIAMQREMQADEAERVFNQQFALMQPELPVIDASGKGQHGIYGTFEDMQAAIMPVLTRFGFSLQHKTRVEDGIVYTTCILRHNSGHQDMCELPLPIDINLGKSNKAGARAPNSIHQIASTKRYGKRYTTEDILCLQVHGDPNSNSQSRQRQQKKIAQQTNIAPKQIPNDRQKDLLMELKATLNSCYGKAAIDEWIADNNTAGTFKKLTVEQYNELEQLLLDRQGMYPT